MKMTQSELAGADFSRSYICQIERGTILPSMNAIKIVAERLRKPFFHFVQDKSMLDEEDVKSLMDMVRTSKRACDEYNYGISIVQLHEIVEFIHLLDDKTKADVYYHLALSYSQGANSEATIQYCIKALEYTGSISNKMNAEIRIMLGEVYFRKSERTEAMKQYLKVREMRLEDDADVSVELVIRLHNDIAEFYYSRGQLDKAIEYLDEAISISKSSSTLHKRILAVYRCYVDILQTQGKHKEAIDFLDGIKMIYDFFDDPCYRGMNMLSYIKSYIELREFEICEQRIDTLKVLISKIEYEEWQNYLYIRCYIEEARLKTFLGDINEAKQIFNQVLLIAEQNKGSSISSLTQAYIYRLLAEFYYELENYENSLMYAGMCEAIYTKCGYALCLSKLYKLMGDTYSKLENESLSIESYQKSKQVLEIAKENIG